MYALRSVVCMHSSHPVVSPALTCGLCAAGASAWAGPSGTPRRRSTRLHFRLRQRSSRRRRRPWLLTCLLWRRRRRELHWRAVARGRGRRGEEKEGADELQPQSTDDGFTDGLQQLSRGRGAACAACLRSPAHARLYDSAPRCAAVCSMQCCCYAAPTYHSFTRARARTPSAAASPACLLCSTLRSPRSGVPTRPRHHRSIQSLRRRWRSAHHRMVWRTTRW